MLKHLGLISIVSMWIGTYVLLKNHLPDPGKTISKHASKSARYHVMYGILEVVVVSIFSLFIFGWFIPTFKLGLDYTVAAIIGFAGTVIAAFIPDREGLRGRVHGLGAYAMVTSLMVMNLALLVNPYIHLLTRASLYISLVFMIAAALIVISRPDVYRKNTLRFQITYFVAFHIPILLAVYS